MILSTAPAPSATRPGAASLVQALREPGAFEHPAGPVELIETHISWVLLSGEYAYKIKKPLKLPFLDFSTLAARRFYCEEELRLNRRTAPALYLGVVRIAGDPPRFGGTGPALEYAVKMRRFPQEALLASLADRGALDEARIDQLARRVADFHAAAESAPPASEVECVDRATRAALDNFSEIAGLAGGRDAHRLALLERWTLAQRRSLARVFVERRVLGCVRECHGDLHLGNVALVAGEPVAFDAIEFSEALRWGDVMSDVAFMAMDLAHRRLPRLAARFVAGYLARTGDRGGLRVLRFYLVYRAMVRAKIEAIRARQLPSRSGERGRALCAFEDYLGLAARLAGVTVPATADEAHWQAEIDRLVQFGGAP
jgi:hypothetical protein